MGSFDGAEICELVGLYMLNKLSSVIDKNNVGLYRDDGLAIISNASRPMMNKIHKKITSLFKKGDLSMEIFAAVMNIPPPVQTKSNNRIVDLLHGAYEKTACANQSQAAQEVKETLKEDLTENYVVDCVSIDGMWQQRGYSSLNRVVVAMCSWINTKHQRSVQSLCLEKSKPFAKHEAKVH